MRLKIRRSLVASLLLAALAPVVGSTQDRTLTIDRFVRHTSTVPANAGDLVGLYLREKITETTKDQIEQGESVAGRVVLFVHGGAFSSVPPFDLDYQDYSWMGYLAEAGFDTFTMDRTGYGRSPRPMMDDPCNMAPEDQAVVMPNSTREPCEPRYKFRLTSVQSDQDEVEAVVDYIRELRGVDRVSLITYSGVGARSGGGFVARHPEKIEKLFMFAPGYDPAGPSAPSFDLPQPGVPMRVQTQDTWGGRWQPNIVCENQVDPGIREVIWQTIIGVDSLGSVWGPPGGVVRRSIGHPAWGWNKEYAARIDTPTLLLIGGQDNADQRAILYDDLTGIDDKVLVRMECGTHYAMWETTQYKFMHEVSREWLATGTFRGQRHGKFVVGVDETAF